MLHELFYKSIHDLKKAFNQYVVFEIAYFLITSFLFVPILAFVLNRLLIIMGTRFLLNQDIFHIVLDYKGLLGFAAIVLIAVIAYYIEIGTLLVIAQKTYFDKPVLLTEAVITAIRSMPKVLGIGLISFLSVSLLILPFVQTAIAPPFFDRIILPRFVLDTFYQNLLYMLGYLVYFLIIVYIMVRFIFTLHYILIEDLSTKEAIARSVQLTKSRRNKIVLKFLLFNAALLLIGFLLISSISIIPFLSDMDIGYFTSRSLITLSGFFTFFFAITLAPANVVFLTRLFYHYRKEAGYPPVDELHTISLDTIGRFEHRVRATYHKRKTILFALIILYGIGALFVNILASDSLMHIGRDVRIAAHRGDPVQAPENTISAIRAALSQGADIIEIDVHLTKDGIPVLHHDRDLMRIARMPDRIDSLTYEELSQIDIGRFHSAAFEGETIPSLESALHEVRSNAKMLIEIKPYGDPKILAQAVLAVIERLGMEEYCYIQSYSLTILQHVRQLNPNIPIGQIMFFAIGTIDLPDVDFFSVEYGMLSTSFVRRVREMGKGLWVWTVNKEESIKEVLQYDIDVLITDYVSRIQSIIGLDSPETVVYKSDN